MTNPDYTALAMLIDRSGSTASIKTDMDGGIAALLLDQLAEPGKATLWLADFDTEYRVLHSNVALSDLPIPAYKVQPRGMTALLDSMMRAIADFGASLAAMPEDERPSKVIFSIYTDGLENASKEMSRDDVFKAVRTQAETYGWQFLYLGADQDAIAEAGGLGIDANSALTYNRSAAGTSYTAASAAITRSRRGKRMEFTEEERSAAAESTPQQTPTPTPVRTGTR